jgi:hypothetical protein
MRIGLTRRTEDLVGRRQTALESQAVRHQT